MDDPRLKKLRDAALAMQAGKFDVDVPPGGDDDLTRLGVALSDLGRELEERFAEAERLARMTEEVNAALLLNEVLDRIYESFRPVIPYERVSLALLEDEGRISRIRWNRSDRDDVRLHSGYVASMNGSSLPRVMESGTPRIINDLEEYLARRPDSESTRLLVEEGMRSSLTCPLRALTRPVGFLFFTSGEPDTYTDEHVGLMLRVGNHLSMVVEKSRLYEEVVDLNWQLGVTRDALEYQASHDSLTSLWNRAAILDITAKELSRARRENTPLSLLLLDVDHFKEVNDEHGHLVGDEVLQEIGRRLAGAIRSYESVGRYGGEEFLISLYGCGEDGARHAAERLRRAVAATPISTDAGDLTVTMSVGAAVCEQFDDDVDVEKLLRSADSTLYAAKQAGRDTHEIERI